MKGDVHRAGNPYACVYVYMICVQGSKPSVLPSQEQVGGESVASVFTFGK